MTLAKQLEASRGEFFRAVNAAREKFENDTGYIVTGIELDHVVHRSGGSIDNALITDFRVRVSAPRHCNPHQNCGIIFEGDD